MKVLLDVRVSPRPRQPLGQLLAGTAVESAVYHDWRSLPENELLAVAERSGFTTMVTMDKRIQRAWLQRRPRGPPDAKRPGVSLVL